MNIRNDDMDLEALLREAGPREGPSPQVLREVQAAVHAEWRAMLAGRGRRRRIVGWSAAAGVAVLAIGTALGLQFLAPARPVATVAKVDGTLEAKTGREWTARDAGHSILAGQTVRTGAQSRAALSLGKQLSVRLDHDTRVEIVAADRIVLTAGALYVDSPGRPGEDPLRVETAVGTLRHVGTQYQVRTRAGEIYVDVREGRVAVARAGGNLTGSAGERLHITSRGEVLRTPLSPRDAAWAWTVSTAAAFDINDRPLAAFLAWMARETGRRLVYASPEAQSAAEGLLLKGSIAGLDPDAALEAVLATTQLRRSGLDDAVVEIGLADAIDSAQGRRPTH